MYLLGAKGWTRYSEGSKDTWYIVPCWLIIDCGTKKKKSECILDVGKSKRISQSFLNSVCESSELKKRDKSVSFREFEEEIVFRYTERTEYESSSRGSVSVWTQ